MMDLHEMRKKMLQILAELCAIDNIMADIIEDLDKLDKELVAMEDDGR